MLTKHDRAWLGLCNRAVPKFQSLDDDLDCFLAAIERFRGYGEDSPVSCYIDSGYTGVMFDIQPYDQNGDLPKDWAENYRQIYVGRDSDTRFLFVEVTNNETGIRQRYFKFTDNQYQKIIKILCEDAYSSEDEIKKDYEFEVTR